MIAGKRKRAALVLCSMLLIAGCGSSDHYSGSSMSSSYNAKGMYDDAEPYAMAESAEWDYDYDYEYDEGTGSSAELGDAEKVGENAATSSRKLITTMNISTETTELEQMVAWVEQRVSSLGGYIESESVNNGSAYSSYRSRKSASMTLRIPAVNLASFVDEVTEHGNITSQNRSVEDVTLSYVDVESKRKTLRAEEEQLLGFMERAETIDDLIAVESRLTEVRYQLESAEAQIRTYDNKINYSTIYLDISEVEVYTPVEEPGVGERIVSGFKESLDDVCRGLTDFFVWFVTHIPQLIVFAVVVVIIVFIIRKIRDYYASHREAAEAKRQERRAKRAEKAAKKSAQKKAGAAPQATYGFQQPVQPVQPAQQGQQPVQTQTQQDQPSQPANQSGDPGKIGE